MVGWNKVSSSNIVGSVGNITEIAVYRRHNELPTTIQFMPYVSREISQNDIQYNTFAIVWYLPKMASIMNYQLPYNAPGHLFFKWQSLEVFPYICCFFGSSIKVVPI